jgi:fructose-bisphosphate aldolase class II
MKQIVAERMRQFGQAGRAGDYQPLTLDDMRARYEAEDTAAPAGTEAVV